MRATNKLFFCGIISIFALIICAALFVDSLGTEVNDGHVILATATSILLAIVELIVLAIIFFSKVFQDLNDKSDGERSITLAMSTTGVIPNQKFADRPEILTDSNTLSPIFERKQDNRNQVTSDQFEISAEPLTLSPIFERRSKPPQQIVEPRKSSDKTEKVQSFRPKVIQSEISDELNSWDGTTESSLFRVLGIKSVQDWSD